MIYGMNSPKTKVIFEHVNKKVNVLFDQFKEKMERGLLKRKMAHHILDVSLLILKVGTRLLYKMVSISFLNVGTRLIRKMCSFIYGLTKKTPHFTI